MAEKNILSTYGSTMRAVADTMYQESAYKEDTTLPDPDLICGIELEIEGFRPRDNTVGFRFEQDGSLRNNGQEAISLPTQMKYFPAMLEHFFTFHRINSGNYSERCSTHVHVNVQDMTFTQLRVLCLVYQVFERLLFNFVANNREENIFCVPWYQSGMSPLFVDKIQRNPDGVMRGWIKYSALNLLPVRSQGTVEFRHLHGTCHLPTILNWMKVLSRMFMYAKRTNPKELKDTILQLNTVSNYDAFMTDVFGAEAGILAVGDYRTALSSGVIDAKLMLLTPKQPKAKELRKEESLGDILHGLNERVARRAAPQVRPRRDEQVVNWGDGVVAQAVNPARTAEMDAALTNWAAQERQLRRQDEAAVLAAAAAGVQVHQRNEEDF